MKSLLFIYCFLSLITACSGRSNASNTTETNESSSDPTINAFIKEAAQKILSARDEFLKEQPQEMKCGWESYNNPESMCFLEDVGFTPANQSSSSNGKRILILDEKMTYFGASLFQKAIVGMYQFSSSSSELKTYPYDLVEGQDQFKIPRFYKNIHTDILGLSEKRIPSKAFRAIDQKYSRSIRGYFVPAFSIEHDLVTQPSYGLLSLAYLYDNIPDAQFVLVNEPLENRLDIGSEQLCSIQELSEEQIKAIMLYKLKQVDDVSSRHEIDYILAPNTHTLKELIEYYQGACNEEPTDLEMQSIKFLYEGLSEYRNGLAKIGKPIVFQPAIGDVREDSHYTCEKLENRIIVAPTKKGVVFDDIPETGSKNKNKYSDDLKGYKCADVFIHNGRPMFGDDTVSHTTSFSFIEYNDKKDSIVAYFGDRRLSAAVALAYSIYRIGTGDVTSGDLKDELRARSILSPTQHNQTPACAIDASNCDYNYRYF